MLQKQIKKRMLKHVVQTVLVNMGYSLSSIPKATARLTGVISDSMLGIGSGKYDFKYSDKEFLKLLCQTLDISSNMVSMFLKDERGLVIKKSKAFRSHIFIDTGFKRECQPIFALACMESRRNITFSIEECILPRMWQIEIASNKAKNHYKNSGGKLELWGEINRYVFQCEENTKIIIDTDGEVIKDDDSFTSPRAVMHL